MPQGSGRDGAGTGPTTAPPPFDPEQYARDSEVSLPAGSPVAAGVPTREVPSPPPLNRPVALRVPLADLPWFDLSDAALALAGRLDGTRTLHDLIEGGPEEASLEAMAQLHDAGLLVFPPEPSPTE